MKRLIALGSLVVGSVLILGVSANAQIFQQYRAEIPFDFHAGGATYQAGEYRLVPLRTESAQSAIRLQDVKNRKSRLLGPVVLGTISWDVKGKLIFVKADGHYTLSEIVTPTFAIRMKNTETSVAAKPAADLKTVAINLH
jgi:hypothetical protein